MFFKLASRFIENGHDNTHTVVLELQTGINVYNSPSTTTNQVKRIKNEVR